MQELLDVDGSNLVMSQSLSLFTKTYKFFTILADKSDPFLCFFRFGCETK
ncbi:hypothetical protein PMEGAS70_26210 [Priestia megaterium]|uniref:Uncharacterized protein n=1 Tax=Priestia megaterium TaxID=1404 RepID=A0AAX6BQD8_PRIMG|nr:hypothetical protein ShirakiTB12_43820 [Priestia megaterium]